MCPARILVGVDDSIGARAALRWALRQAKATGAEVDAVRAYAFEIAWIDHDQRDERLEEWKSRSCRDARAELHRVVDEVVADVATSPDFEPVPDVQALVVEGQPARVLVDLAREADLLVVGRRGRGRIGGLLLGSVSQRCVERSSCATAVVTADAPVKRIVVGVDGSASAQAALAWAVQEAAITGAVVEAVCAYVSTIAVSPHPAVPTVSMERFREGASRILRDAILRVEVPAGVTISPVVSWGQAADVLSACAADADLVVMGTRGLGGVKGLLLGSVTHRVMTRVGCPVVVLPARTREKVPQTVG